MSVANGTGNTAPVLTTVTVLTFLWALCSYFVRSIVKIKLGKSEAWGPDDIAITAAMVAALGQMICVCYSVNHGYGNVWQSLADDDHLTIAKSLYASQILYVVSIASTKVSAALFNASFITRDPQNVFIARISIVPCVTWAVGAVFAIAFRGDVGEPWETFNGSQSLFVRWTAIEATGFAIDVFAAALTTYFVHGLQMSVMKKLAVLVILNFRLILALPIAVRLYYLHPSTEGSRHGTAADIVTVAVMHAAIFLASITCLKPFLRPFDPVAFGATASRSGLFRYTTEHEDSRNRSERYYELSGTRSAKDGKKGPTSEIRSKSSGNELDGEDELPLRPHDISHVAAAQSERDDPGDRVRGDARSISKTQSWTVSVSNAMK